MARASVPTNTPEDAPRPTRKADKPDAARAMPLNFKVSADFRREFKTYAAQHNKKLNQLLYEAFAALKTNHAD
ncbi:MAG: hypothetical protein ABSE93_16390 [Terriglobia bacterium]|jgi:hypothetical protein